MATNLPLSIVVSIAVAFMNSTGYYFQKSGQNQIESGLPVVKYWIAAIKTPKWLLGMALNLGTMPLYIFALSIGHISITQPLANTGIILLVIIGMRVLKESMGRNEIISVAILIGGMFLIAFSMPEPVGAYTLVQAEVVAFAVIAACLFGGCVALILLRKKAIGFALFSGIAMGVAASTIKIISILISDLGYPSFSLLDFGLDMNLIFGILGGEFQLVSMLFYLVVLLILSYFVTLVFAFKHGKLTLVGPLQMGMSFILPVFTGFLLFHEPVNALLVPGIAMCLLGALMLSQYQARLEARIASTGTSQPSG